MNLAQARAESLFLYDAYFCKYMRVSVVIHGDAIDGAGPCSVLMIRIQDELANDH